MWAWVEAVPGAPRCFGVSVLVRHSPRFFTDLKKASLAARFSSEQICCSCCHLRFSGRPTVRMLRLIVRPVGAFWRATTFLGKMEWIRWREDCVFGVAYGCSWGERPPLPPCAVYCIPSSFLAFK